METMGTRMRQELTRWNLQNPLIPQNPLITPLPPILRTRRSFSSDPSHSTHSTHSLLVLFAFPRGVFAALSEASRTTSRIRRGPRNPCAVSLERRCNFLMYIPQLIGYIAL